MSVYIDPPGHYKPNGRVAYSHITADTPGELRSFACFPGNFARISGIRKGHPHFDLPSHRYQEAIDNGAIPTSPQNLLAQAKKLATIWNQRSVS